MGNDWNLGTTVASSLGEPFVEATSFAALHFKVDARDVVSDIGTTGAPAELPSAARLKAEAAQELCEF